MNPARTKPKQVKTSTIADMKEHIRLIQASNKDLMAQIADEQTKIRLPATMSSEQFNDICAHLEKVREKFMEIVKVPGKVIELPKEQDALSTSQVN